MLLEFCWDCFGSFGVFGYIIGDIGCQSYGLG